MKLRSLILAAAVLASAHAAVAETVPCRFVYLNVIDNDPAGLNVRASPGGPVITRLKARGRWVQVDLSGQDGAWARITKATLEGDENGEPQDTVLWQGVGWVAFSKLGVQPFGSLDRFRAGPDPNAKMVLSLEDYGDKRVAADAILGCDGPWVKVRIERRIGWTDQWCTNKINPCQ